MQPIKLQQLSAFRHWGNDPIQLVKLNITMGKGDLGDFAELGVVVVARLADLYIFAELLGFSHIGICRLYRECSKKKRKYPVCSSSKCLSDTRDQRTV